MYTSSWWKPKLFCTLYVGRILEDYSGSDEPKMLRMHNTEKIPLLFHNDDVNNMVPGDNTENA
jgi:hypothetical protein